MSESKLKSQYIEIRHPVTGRFMLSIDFDRWVICVTDRGKRAYIDLAEIQDRKIARKVT